MPRILSLVALVLLLSCTCIGCGPGGPALGTVSGVVTLDGKPVTDGLITFSPEGGGPTATGTTDATGKYELISGDRKGAPVGKHKVTVTTLQKAEAVPEVRSDSPEYAKMAAGGGGDYSKQPPKEKIPAKYNTATELTQEVKSGSNEINLELKSS